MNRYKAITRIHFGQSFIIMCKKDWLPSTHKVLAKFTFHGFIPTTYCFLISTAKSLPWFVCDANSHITLTHEISNALYLLIRQHLSLVFPYYWRSLLSSCKRPSLKRNLFLFGLQNNSVFKELFLFFTNILYHILNLFSSFCENIFLEARVGFEPTPTWVAVTLLSHLDNEPSILLD